MKIHEKEKRRKNGKENSGSIEKEKCHYSDKGK